MSSPKARRFGAVSLFGNAGATTEYAEDLGDYSGIWGRAGPHHTYLLDTQQRQPQQHRPRVGRQPTNMEH